MKCRTFKPVFWLCSLFLLSFQITVLAQSTTVSGKITSDENSNGLPGVTVNVAGTTNGTVSDASGNYELAGVSPRDSLVFSSIGYNKKTIAVGGRKVINVTLSSSVSELNQLVVIGYGTQKAENLTAAIDTANMQVISAQPVTNIAEAMQGRVAGLNIRSTADGGGQPGEDMSIQIRGRRSLSASNTPLIVIDGMPFDGSLADISAQNVKSISVLKDASATAIYGSRGANGVILITTKGGGNHPTRISYNAYYGITEPMRRPDMMNGQQFAAMKREANRRVIDNGNITFSWKGELPSYEDALKPKEYEGFKNGVSTNWPDLVLHNGNRQGHNLSISGGNENTTFFVAGNFQREKALVPTNTFTRYGLRINLEHHIGDKFTMGVSSSISRYDKDYNTNPLGEALLDSPLGKPYDENGNLIFLPISDGLRSNPLFDLKPGAILNERRYNKVFATLFAQYDLLKNLTYRVSFSPDYTDATTNGFTGSMTTSHRGEAPTARKYNRHTFDYVLQNKLNYNISFGKDQHHLEVLLLQSIEKYHYENSDINVRGLPFESQKYNNIGTATVIDNFSSDLNEWQLASFLGRINYDFKDKYLLQLSARADGSSRLAAGNKWNVFPGVSAGWRIINESFMEDADFVNNLKLRVSYGVVGNTSIDPYQTQGSLSRTTYAWDESEAYGYALSNIANPGLGWEKTATYDIGIDFGFFRNRLSGSIDYYNSHTSDLLLQRQLPFTSGYDRILQNVGETGNSGFEISVKSKNFEGDGRNSFTWTTALNWSHYKERIIKLFSKTQDDIGNGWFIGYPIEVFYDYQKIGIWQKEEVEEAAKYGEVPGEIKVKDQNDDGLINGDDRIILGSPEPDWSAGMTNSFAYKGFDLSVLVNAQVGGLLRSNFHTSYNTLVGRYNNLNVDYWTPDNPTNAYPRPNLNQEHPLYSSSLNIFDGSYVKIQNVTLGYSLPHSILDNWHINRIRIYASVENLHVFSPYKVKDPSISGDIGSAIPTPRAFLVGLNLDF